MTFPQAHLLLKAVLPRAQFGPEVAIEYVSYLQRQSYVAYLAHRRATQERLDGL